MLDTMISGALLTVFGSPLVLGIIGVAVFLMLCIFGGLDLVTSSVIVIPAFLLLFTIFPDLAVLKIIMLIGIGLLVAFMFLRISER